MDDRQLAAGAGLTRVGIGIAMLLAPRRAGASFLGSEASRPATQAVVRMLGARDLLLGLGLWRAANGGRSTKSWLAYSAIADGADAAALLGSWRALPRVARAAMLPLAAGSAAVNGLLSARAD